MLLRPTIPATFTGSGIDLELWIIPLSICWLVTVVGILGSAVAAYVIAPTLLAEHSLLPVASAGTGALALGSTLGLAISFGLLRIGLIKRSYEVPEAVEGQTGPGKERTEPLGSATPFDDEPEFNHRLEALREMVFLTPIIICAIAAHALATRSGAVATWWGGVLAYPVVAGFFGSLFGYFVGCAVIWATRIFGTLAFGKEAMGLGDVHLMGAAGTVIGPVMVVLAFFIAPFFGLGWAFFLMFFKKIRQIPYGPFLSFAVFTVMILHDWILNRFASLFLP